LPLPELRLGLVVRYEYLWARRANIAETADKDHPACVVATYRVTGSPEDFVVYLPISHTPPAEGEEGIELSDQAKSSAGLDARRQWILVSECNVDAWPFDVRSLPRDPRRFHYGSLPQAAFREVRDRFVARYRMKRVRQVQRAPPR
jgi:hypothetical protein